MSYLKLFLAATPTPPPALPAIQTGNAGIASVLTSLFNFALWGIGIAAVVMTIYAGFMYIISAGRPDRVKLAFQSIVYIAVGFGIVILARSIVEAIAPIANQSNIQGVVSSGITFFLWVVGVAATIMVIISGMFYITSAGDPGRTKAAKDTLMYAVIGLGIALIGGGIITYLQSILQ